MVKNWIIGRFVKRYGVDLSLALKEDLKDYLDFNHFFTRALKPSVRPIAPELDVIVSPVDGSLSKFGTIKGQDLLQAKGAYFTLNDLLGRQSNLPSFEEGHYATFYLSPKDYHRVHLPFAGTLTQTIYIPGKLFSVNPVSAENIPQLFARNERLVCLFETELGPMAVILIGAMLVGKIETVWGLVERSRKVLRRHYEGQERRHFEKGAELGRFLMGSSVIVLFPKNTLAFLSAQKEQACVHMGAALAKRLH